MLASIKEIAMSHKSLIVLTAAVKWSVDHFFSFVNAAVEGSGQRALRD